MESRQLQAICSSDTTKYLNVLCFSDGLAENKRFYWHLKFIYANLFFSPYKPLTLPLFKGERSMVWPKQKFTTYPALGRKLQFKKKVDFCHTINAITKKKLIINLDLHFLYSYNKTFLLGTTLVPFYARFYVSYNIIFPIIEYKQNI